MTEMKEKRTPDMSVEIAGVKFKNPVMTASGTFGSGMEYAELTDIGRLGSTRSDCRIRGSMYLSSGTSLF